MVFSPALCEPFSRSLPGTGSRLGRAGRRTMARFCGFLLSPISGDRGEETSPAGRRRLGRRRRTLGAWIREENPRRPPDACC